MKNPKDKSKQKQVQKDAAAPIVEKIKNSDKALLLLQKNGRVEVLGVKNMNFALEAKALLYGALDTYSVKAIVGNLNQVLTNIQIGIGNLNAEINKLKPEVKAEEKDETKK